MHNMEGSNPPGFQIPVIDLTANIESLGKDVVDAAEQYGFVFIRNQTQGISAEAIERAFDLVWPPVRWLLVSRSNVSGNQSRTLFRSPREEKEKCSISSNVHLPACSSRMVVRVAEQCYLGSGQQGLDGHAFREIRSGASARM